MFLLVLEHSPVQPFPPFHSKLSIGVPYFSKKKKKKSTTVIKEIDTNIKQQSFFPEDFVS